MAITILDKEINRIKIVDDSPDAREAFQLTVDDLKVVAILETGPINNIESFIKKTQPVADAVICDFSLTQNQYATVNGAEIVAKFYQNNFPAILFTRYENTSFEEIRRYRQFIPILLNPTEVEPDTLIDGLQQCIAEFNNSFRPSRRPWRTLIRVDYINKERGILNVVIPAWAPSEVVSLYLDSIPDEILSAIVDKGVSRVYAQVNIGAEENHSIYFQKWELG